MYLAVRAECATTPEQMGGDSYISLSGSCPVQEDVCSAELDVLKVQLRQAEETAQRVQREVPPAAPPTDPQRVNDLSVTRLSQYKVTHPSPELLSPDWFLWLSVSVTA